VTSPFERQRRLDAIDIVIRALVQARLHRQPAVAAHLPLLDAAAAYAVQEGVARAFGWFADSGPTHWKSGGASREAVLTHAPLPPEGVWASPADARHWPFRQRGIEAEVALRLGREVNAAQASCLDPATAAGLIDAMCVSIEIVDSRWLEGLNAPPLSKLADLQTHGALVLGAWVPFALRDWTQQVCRVSIGARRPTEYRGTHALADPLFLLPAWLCHATRGGVVVPAGTVVTTGTWCGVLDAAAGDRVFADFPGIGQAEVQL
jgi:2-keto-4-pentenoate hydratase